MGLFPVISLFSQVVYEPVTNNSVYDLLDELSTLKVITINSAVKPYSRTYIAEKLAEASRALADTTDNEINKRLRDEIALYLRGYRIESQTLSYQTINYDPIGYTYRGKVFKLSLLPSVGGRFLVNENGNLFETTGGGEMFVYIGKHIGFYINVKQTWESEPLVEPEYFMMEEGKVWKELKNGSVSNTEWRGGLSVNWKWGDFGVYKDRPAWGDAQHGSNILSGRVPSFPFLQLHLKPATWFEFTYIAGLLNSVYLDSIYREGTISPDNRARKYFIGNMITVTPWKSLQFSIGNSIIYSEKTINPAFLIPFFFYKSVDQAQSNLSVDNGQNNQLFFNIYFRAFHCLSVYTSIFVDDFKKEAFLKAGQHNEISSKIGFRLADWPLKNVILEGEYTRTNPLTYQHIVTPIDYYSNGYCLGNYLRDNSEEIFFRLIFKPTARIILSGEYLFFRHGQDFQNIAALNNYTLPVLNNISSRVTTAGINLKYQLFNRFMIDGGFSFRNSGGDVKYAPLIFHGITYSVYFGFQIGL